MGYARITIEVAADGLSAAARVFAGPAVDEAGLGALLAEAGVVYGIRHDALQRLATALREELFTVDSFVLAEGDAPLPGRDGALALAFSTGIQPGHVRPDGTMDFLDRELLKPVTAGELLAQLHGADPGRPGRRVDGTELSVAKTREAALKLGPGAVLRDDGAIVAARAGVVLYAPPGQLDVVQHHEHRGKVDLRSGHLDMEGSLRVRGDVERLFRASASGDVEVQGSVEYGSVQAGGSLRVTGGVRGGESGLISVEGDVAARHAEAARIVCGGLLKLEHAVNCELRAGDVQITGKLRGGTTQAERGIRVHEAGAALGTSTTLAAGVPLERPLLDAKRAIERAKEQRALVHGSLARGTARFDRGARDDTRMKGGKAGRAAAALASSELERKVALANRRSELLAGAFIEVSGPVHPGVSLQIGSATLTVQEPGASLRCSFDPETRALRTERFVR